MKKEKVVKFFKSVFIILFVMFISVFIALESGYYDTKVREKVVLTDEMIKEFERDVEEGNPVDIKKYTIDDTHDYSNNISKAGMHISKNVEKLMTKGIGKMFNFIGKMFT